MFSLLKQFVVYFRLFYRYARWRLPALYMLITVGGLVEAVGIVMLLPLLNVATGEYPDSGISKAIAGALEALGITVTLTNLLLVIVVIFALRGVVVFLYTFVAAYLAISVRAEVQTELTQKFCEMGFPYYASKSAGWFNNMIVTEVGRYTSSMRSFTRLSVNVIHVAIFLPLALSLKFELTLAVFAISGLILLSLRRFISRTAELSRQQTIEHANMNAELIQLIQAFTYLKATALMKSVSRHVVKTIRDLARIDITIRLTGAFLESIKEPIAVTALAGLIFYEVVVLGGSLPEIAVVALLMYRMLMQLISLAPQLQGFNQLVGGVFAVRDATRDLAVHSERGGEGRIDSSVAPIVFHNVSFQHDKTAVLRGVDLAIGRNEMVGIVGESGAGKTTFFHLLTGLLEPTSGHITVAGRDYAELDKDSIREMIGYVTQEPVIFNDTVANNISMWQCDGEDGACLERIRAAAHAAKCDEFVDAMENGFDTTLGDRGIRLSGGQKQRIAIARELFKNPRILIFDEAASALDAESESFVQESIVSMRGKRTIVIITHRLASVRICDRIYVFSDGRVVEQGMFDELYRHESSRFRRMCDHQGVAP